MNVKSIVIAGFLLISICGVAFARPLKTVKECTEDTEVNLRAGAVQVIAELAVTPAKQQQGLMYRDSLEPDHGMLFILQTHDVCFWMKNTYIDLDIAFIDENGRITGISAMKAESLDLTCSIGPAVYALEMSSGWFKEHNVNEGDLVELQ